jgi:hypothetical protein
MSSVQIPSWLDATKRVDKDHPATPSGEHLYAGIPKATARASFLLLCMAALFRADPAMTTKRAIEVTANSVGETGHGEEWVGYNFGGWKITRANVDAWKATHNGECPPWVMKAGHVKSGDAPIVYYRVFASPDEFFAEWLARFVPKGKKVGEHRYAKTGEKFWKDDLTWFTELCLAGYKGDITAANPGPSFDKHKNIVNEMIPRIAQKLLKVNPDGVWGSGTSKACREFQYDHRLSVTGTLTTETFAKLIEVWKASGFPL